MARRGNGEGTINKRTLIKKRKDGTEYEYVYYEAKISNGYDANGKPKRITLTGKKRHELAKKMEALLADQQKQLLVDLNKITVEEHFIRWLETKIRSGKTKITTSQAYEMYTNKHIIPGLGQIPIQKLTPVHIQNFYNNKLAEGLRPATVIKLHGMIHNALKQAVKEGIVGRNVSEGLELPRNDSKAQFRVLSIEELKRLTGVAADHELYPALLLEIHTGLRKGELLGLRWSSVDLEAGTIHVTENLIVKAGNKEKGIKEQLLFDTPKSKSSIRRIHIPSTVINVLRNYKEKDIFNHPINKDFWLAKYPLKYSQTLFLFLVLSRLQCNNLVFHTKNGTPIHTRNLSRTYYDWLKKAGIPGNVRFHDLRHTHATQLIANNANIVSVQSRLGHSDIRTTQIYAHALAEQDIAAADIMENLLK